MNMPLSLNKYFKFYIFSQTHICRLACTPSNPQFGKQLQGLSGGVSLKICNKFIHEYVCMIYLYTNNTISIYYIYIHMHKGLNEFSNV